MASPTTITKAPQGRRPGSGIEFGTGIAGDPSGTAENAYAALPVPPGMVRIYSTQRQVTLILADAPDRSGGVGGWERSERPKRRPASRWSGTPAHTGTLTCWLDVDVNPDGASVEKRLDDLYAMGKPDDIAEEPLPVRLAGDVSPGDRRMNWVIQDIKLGDRLHKRPDGRYRRLQVVVELEDHVPLSGIDKVTVTRTRPAGGRRNRRSIATRQGDTLRTIAVRELGDQARWKQIVIWNPKFKKLDPDEPLATGTKVVLGGKAKK